MQFQSSYSIESVTSSLVHFQEGLGSWLGGCARGDVGSDYCVFRLSSTNTLNAMSPSRIVPRLMVNVRCSMASPPVHMFGFTRLNPRQLESSYHDDGETVTMKEHSGRAPTIIVYGSVHSTATSIIMLTCQSHFSPNYCEISQKHMQARHATQVFHLGTLFFAKETRVCDGEL